MRKLFITFIGLFINLSVFASETVLTLDQQIIDVTGYLKTLQHPRLILGVGNAPDLNGNPGPNPFLENPNDILVNDQQKQGLHLNRSLTVNFNDLVQLNKLAEAFPNAFDVITTDFLVTKYAAWTKEHLETFRRMLKPEGILCFPCDNNFNQQIMIKADTLEELFMRTAEENKLSTMNTLSLSGEKWVFEHLPVTLTIPVDPQMQQEIDSAIAKDKEFRAQFDDSTPEALKKSRAKMRELGITLPFTIRPTLFDDNKLAAYVKGQVIKSHTTDVRQRLSDEFIEEYVIPQNWKRIIAEVFEPEKITIQKNLPLPQPHREVLFSEYSISATK